jgi:hypothetical protein
MRPGGLVSEHGTRSAWDSGVSDAGIVGWFAESSRRRSQRLKGNFRAVANCANR